MTTNLELYPLTANLIKNEIELSYAFKTYKINNYIEIMDNTPSYVLIAIERYLQDRVIRKLK